MNIDPKDIRHRLARHSKVIMAVDILGPPVGTDLILEIGGRNVNVLNDYVRAVTANYKGRAPGWMGECGIYSIKVDKSISAGDPLVDFQLDVVARSALQNTFLFGYTCTGEDVWVDCFPVVRHAAQDGCGAGFKAYVEIGARRTVANRALLGI